MDKRDILATSLWSWWSGVKISSKTRHNIFFVSAVRAIMIDDGAEGWSEFWHEFLLQRGPLLSRGGPMCCME